MLEGLVQGYGLLAQAIPFWPLLWAVPLGAAMGSFINCMADRIPRKQNLRHPPSFCDSCYHTLGWSELIPLFSWLFQKGRCKHCGHAIPARNFWLEVLTTLIPIILYLILGISLLWVCTTLIGWLLVGFFMVKAVHVP